MNKLLEILVGEKNKIKKNEGSIYVSEKRVYDRMARKRLYIIFRVGEGGE